MNELITTILEALKVQREQLTATIEELNATQSSIEKDSTIFNDRLDKITVDLNNLNEAIKQLSNKEIDLTPYATKEALEAIDIPNYDTLKDELLRYVEAFPKAKDGINGRDGIDGINGVDGKNGIDGLNGKDGINGKDGRDGLNGINGEDGKDGTGIESINYKDGYLYIYLTDGNVNKFKLDIKTITKSGVQYIQSSSSVGDSFESISQNISSYPKTLNYTGLQLTSISFNLGNGKQITKTLNYTGEVLTSISLSGDVPMGVKLNKALEYDGDALVSVSYF